MEETSDVSSEPTEKVNVSPQKSAEIRLENISDVVTECKEKIKESLQLPPIADYLGKNGDITMIFLHYLCMDEELMYTFLRRCGLLKSSVTCEACKTDMFVRYERNQDRHVWRCMRRVKRNVKGRVISVRCNGSKAVRFGSWFSQSKMSVAEILWISYAIVNKTPLKTISKEYGIGKHTLVDWANFCREVYTHHMQVHSNKIGGQGKVVEVDERNFGSKRSEDHGNSDGQWVLGGVEKDCGKCFLVPIKDRSNDEFAKLIKDWVLPGTIVVTDSCEHFEDLVKEGYLQEVVNREDMEGNYDSINGIWKHIKESQPERSRGDEHFAGYLAMYMFHKHCEAENVDVFVRFLQTVRAMYPC